MSISHHGGDGDFNEIMQNQMWKSVKRYKILFLGFSNINFLKRGGGEPGLIFGKRKEIQNCIKVEEGYF